MQQMLHNLYFKKKADKVRFSLLDALRQPSRHLAHQPVSNLLVPRNESWSGLPGFKQIRPVGSVPPGFPRFTLIGLIEI